MLRQQISDTSFLVAESRARRLDISRDAYARHWMPPTRLSAVASLWDDFSREVYPHDDLELAIRNRFFLERLQRFSAAHEDAAFVNVGAGLTSYPFLLERQIPCYECDLPNIVRFKQRRMTELSSSGILPPRDVTLLPLDVLREDGREQIRSLLITKLAKRPTFVLLEGLSYYLNFVVLESLFDVFREGQLPGSQVAMDFWMPDLRQHPVFLRLQEFFGAHFGFPAQDYCLFDEEWIGRIRRYRVIESSSVSGSEQRYAASTVLSDEREMLPENYALLERLS